MKLCQQEEQRKLKKIRKWKIFYMLEMERATLCAEETGGQANWR